MIDANYGARAMLAQQLRREVVPGDAMLEAQARASFDFWLAHLDRVSAEKQLGAPPASPGKTKGSQSTQVDRGTERWQSGRMHSLGKRAEVMSPLEGSESLPLRHARARCTLTLIRHGPTEWNETRRFQGRTDLPLSALGRAHARAIATALARRRRSKVYSSDLVRARESNGAPIAEASRGVPLVDDARLREFDFGRWEGLTWDEIVALDPELARRPSKRRSMLQPARTVNRSNSSGGACERFSTT